MTSKTLLWKLAQSVGYTLGLIVLLTLTFLLLGIEPISALKSLWAGAIGDAENGHIYPLSETLVETSPLLLTGLSIVVAWRAGLFSIGGEGQLLMGVVAATAIAKGGQNLPGPLLTFAMLLGGTLAGAGWGAIAGWLRVRRNVQEVISTIMLNYIALYFLGWMVEGPLQEKAKRIAQSDPLPNASLFAHLIPQTRLHSGVIIAFLVAIAIYLFLFYTRKGFALRVMGQNPEAARVARFPVESLRFQAMAISGGLCGLAGVIELLGVTGRLYSNFSPGWGFTAIPVALLGGLHPIGTLFSALFFGALTAGSGNLARFSGVSSVLIYVIQAVAVLTVVGARAWQAQRRGTETE